MSARPACSATRRASPSESSPCTSKLGTCAKSSSSSGGASGQRSSSTSSSPLRAGTSFPVTGSARIEIVPPVDTTTTVTAKALLADGLGAEPLGEAELFLDPLHLAASERDAHGRQHEQDRDDQQRQDRRGRSERVQVWTHAARERQAADLERERVGGAALEEDAAVVVVPRQREPE